MNSVFQAVTLLRAEASLEKFTLLRGLSVGVFEICHGTIAVWALSLRFNPLKNATVAGALRFLTRSRRTSLPGVTSRPEGPDGCFKAARYIPFRVTAIFPTGDSRTFPRSFLWRVISGDMPRVKQGTCQLGVDPGPSRLPV